MTTSADIRAQLVDTLQLDLVGPGPGHPLEAERLWERDLPSRWYLTGFLVPTDAPDEQRSDPQAEETLDTAVGSEEGTGDDDVEPDRAPARKVYLPSSLGISVIVPSSVTVLKAQVCWGDYKKVPAPDPEHSDRKVWQRTQRSVPVDVPLPAGHHEPIDVEDSRGVRLYVSAREVGNLGPEDGKLPPGTRAISVFVVNERDPAVEDRIDEGLIFQVQLTLKSETGFTARPNLRGLVDHDTDERIADLQYRDAFEFSVGHGISTHAIVDDNGKCHEVRSTWIPTAEVEKVDPSPIDGSVKLEMETLAAVASPAEARAALDGFVPAYGAWIASQRLVAPQGGPRAQVAADLLDRCQTARQRIVQGIDELADPLVLEAFRITNRVMATAARQRSAQVKGWNPAQVAAPRWYPFQLAFLLMNLRGLAKPTDPEREVLDLLFFPTGGGKTEAYLGLAAFALVLRRLRDPSVTSSGVSVLMRYTLRLLTLDQLSRGATLICALELERQRDVEKLGKWPFEIGLWVGRAATPNRMGKKGDDDRSSARAKTIAFQNDSRFKPSPIPIENCPWCGTKFEATSFRLTPNPDHPTDLRIVCANEDCAFTRDNALPILAVDEPLYRRLPCFIIATVDKLASLPWISTPGKLFGKVDRYDAAGFYGPGDGAGGGKLPRPLLPPDLIIQDELHLISGPLGTMVGLYETAVEGLCRRTVDGTVVLPKIVASTATVRRAEPQVRALFNREKVDVFPPPGPDRRDSFFAHTAKEKPPRLYVGVAAQGRSLKVVLLRAYLAMLSAAKKHYDAQGGAANPVNPADPYMTLLGYFNALRELGGSRRIVEDEVRSRLHGYSRHRRANEVDSPFVDRAIQFDAIELTSREPTNRVADAKRRLSLRFSEDRRVDVALATNMISVGLDITRLGLMVVLGQPKTSAEYIQATSRVGRGEDRPGLVITLLNVHKPRDRSHYERFEAYHATFYRAVEATSVTPFAPRAVDRGLAAVVVSLARHGEPALTPAARAADLAVYRARLDWLKPAIRARAENHAKDLDAHERQELGMKMDDRVDALLNAWEQIAAEKTAVQAGLQYGPFEARPRPPLLHDPLDPDLKREPPQSNLRKFKAQWSLRDVEPQVPVIVRRLDGGTPENT